MHLRRVYISFIILLLLSLGSSVKAQFYNGHQMTFGKSRVQYNDFYWQYYRFPKFDTYFYVGGNELAKYVSMVASENIERIEYNLEQILQHRIIFIVYNKLSEFRQSNIGLVTGAEEYNIGGVTRIVGNKVFLYYEGDHNKLNKQIRASITEVIINEMLYGGNFRSRVSSSTMLNLPEWFVPGLISYIAYDTDFDTELKIKSLIMKGKFQKIHRMHGDNAKIAGHAFWRYIAETYGESIVSQIVYMTRISKSVETGFLYVLGMPLKDIMNDWYYYYKARYDDEVKERNKEPDDSKFFIKKTKKKYVYSQVKMSPLGNYIAYTTNQEGQYKIWLYSVAKDRSKRLVKRENKLEQITDYSYPVLAWHPSGNILTWMYERKGHIWFTIYNLDTKEEQTREIFYVDKVLDYSFSDDGQELVISAVENGYTDIFIYSMVASSFKRITNDIADDINPRFADNSSKIIFASNRKTTQIKYPKKIESPFGESYDLFVYDYKHPGTDFTRITNTFRVDEWKPQEYKKNRYFYLTNQNGIYNRGYAKFDSTISFIDTAIHYRTFTKNYPISNRAFSITDYDYNKTNRLFTDVEKKVKRYSLFTNTVDPGLRPKPEDFAETWFKMHYEEKHQSDSLLQLEIEAYKADTVTISKEIFNPNDTLINIDYYVFDIEKKKYSQEKKQNKKSDILMFPKQMVYFTNFYSNLMVTQVDFGFMNQSYQAFTGSAFYFNPGFNILTKVGAIDIFEDYKITGGIRFSIDFESNEYLLSVEDLKKRLDKQYIYHRQVFESYQGYDYSKIFTNEVMTVFKYPITQIHAFRGTISARVDNQVFKSFDQNTLNKPDINRYWGGLKGEYILDNTRKLGLNLYDGTRMKVFGEYYGQVGKNINSHLFVVGTDIRNYIHIHRDLVFASRFAYSTSFGKSLLMYYLGGVDNWMNFSKNTPTFDYSTRIDRDKNWVFQAVGTNMRGFVQNARNGNSFAVANFELRWPVVRYILNRPVSSDFLNNFMVIGFSDLGSAWEGFNPANAVNAYDYQEIYQKPIHVLIDRKRSPVIAGVGFGLRSRLLGYYIRTDWAWGIDGGRVLPRVFYLSLCTDF